MLNADVSPEIKSHPFQSSFGSIKWLFDIYRKLKFWLDFNVYNIMSWFIMGHKMEAIKATREKKFPLKGNKKYSIGCILGNNF